MKWLIFALMGVVFAVNQAGATNLSNAGITTKARNNLRSSVLIDESVSKTIELQGAAVTDKNLSESKSEQLNVRSDVLLKKFFLFDHLQKLFSTSNSSEQSEPSPEPATLFLFGSGLAGCIFIFRRRW